MAIIRARLRDPLSRIYPQNDYTVIGWYRESTVYGEDGVFVQLFYAHDSLKFPFNPLFNLDWNTNNCIEWYEIATIKTQWLDFILANDDDCLQTSTRRYTGIEKVNEFLRKWGFVGIESLGPWIRKINPHPYDSSNDSMFLSTPNYQETYFDRINHSNLFYLVENSFRSLERGAKQLFLEDIYRWYQRQSQLRKKVPVDRDQLVLAGVLDVTSPPPYSDLSLTELQEELRKLNQIPDSQATRDLQCYLIQLITNFQ